MNPSNRKKAKEFFSKDNEDHPLIEENKQLKEELESVKRIKE